MDLILSIFHRDLLGEEYHRAFRSVVSGCTRLQAHEAQCRCRIDDPAAVAGKVVWSLGEELCDGVFTAEEDGPGVYALEGPQSEPFHSFVLSNGVVGYILCISGALDRKLQANIVTVET